MCLPLWDSQLMTGVSLILDETFQFSPSKCDFLTNNITISTKSHQQLIEALHNIQEIYIWKFLDKIVKSTMMMSLLSQNLTKCSESLITETNMALLNLKYIIK